MQPALIMLAAGIGIPILAAMNAALGRAIGSPAVAAVVLFVVALLIAIVTSMLTKPAAFALLPTAPKHLFLAGCFVAFYVLSITWIAPSFGIGNAIFFVLLGQLISAALIDHFGLFGAIATPFSITRALGMFAMVGGVYLTQKY